MKVALPAAGRSLDRLFDAVGNRGSEPVNRHSASPIMRRLAFIVATTLSALLAMHHAPPVTWPVKAIRTPPPEPQQSADTRRTRWPSTHSRVRGNWCAFAGSLRNRTCRVAP